MPQITPTQARYLSFIHAYTEGFGVPPSEAEIAEAMKVQPPSVSGMLKTMVKKGLIEKIPGKARSIEILVETSEIPPWKKNVRGRLDFYAPTGASQETLDQIGNEIVRRRKAERAKTKNKIATRNSSSPETIYRFKITLRNTKPPIWRRIETHDVTIEQFHELIQTSMGWTNSHLHEFEIAGEKFTHPRFLVDTFDDLENASYAGISLTDWIAKHGPKLRMRYLYDFGDGWGHDVALEGVFASEPNVEYPRCVVGKLACPPEDIGGVYGYAEFIKLVSNPKHPRYEEMVDWYGPFDANDFDSNVKTEKMQQGLPSLS